MVSNSRAPRSWRRRLSVCATSSCIRSCASIPGSAAAAGEGALPPAAAAEPGMDAQLRMQDDVAQTLNRLRHERGALEFETIEVRHEFDGETLRDLRPE